MIGPSKSKHKFICYILPVILVLLSSNISNAKSGRDLRPQVSTIVNNLSACIRAKIKQYPNVICGVYIKPSWVKNPPININGNVSFPAASLIKIPIAIVLLQKIDKKNVNWNKVLVLQRKHYAVGAGFLRTRKIGTKIKLKEVFKLMLTISDNTATNMIIELLGGVQATNQEIAKLGLKQTQLNNWLGDFKGINKTSPCDLATLLEKSLEGNLLSKNSRRIFKNMLLSVENTSLIRKGLGRYTRFAHKTGTIGICVGDAGIIYLPFGRRINISIMVKRPFNSLQGQKLVREISRLVYEHLE